MVTFNQQNMIITIHTGTNPTEYWSGLMEELISIVSVASDDADVKRDVWRTLALIRDMVPDYEIAKKMAI